MNTATIVSEVEKLYGRLEVELPAGMCNACGRCCHFHSAGHILYVTEVERIFFASRLPSYQRFDELPPVCPFLLDPLCAARDARPLACRNHFCRENRDAREARYERYHAELREIGRRFAVPYDYSPLFIKAPAYTLPQDAGGILP